MSGLKKFKCDYYVVKNGSRTRTKLNSYNALVQSESALVNFLKKKHSADQIDIMQCEFY